MIGQPKVSVIVCTYNESRYLRDCIPHILDQSFPDFELVIMDDGSTDDTSEIVAAIADPRIRYYKQEINSGAIGKIRMIAVGRACGEYIFFTDADCLPTKTWLEDGLRAFEKTGAMAIEGKVIYYRDNYRPTLSDRILSNLTGGEWKTANMAFRRLLFEEFSFNPTYPILEDRELALRIKRKYSIPFVPQCLIYHQKKRLTVRLLFKQCDIGVQKLRLIKEQSDVTGNGIRMFDIYSFRIMLFPPLILMKIIRGQVKSWHDFKLLLFLWPAAIYTRLLVWKTAFREKIFII